VIWAKSVNDVAIALDKEPSIVGNIRLLAGIAHKIPPSGLPIEDDDAYTCHLDTCTRKRTLTAARGHEAAVRVVRARHGPPV